MQSEEEDMFITLVSHTHTHTDTPIQGVVTRMKVHVLIEQSLIRVAPGSERVGKSEATGDRLDEAKHINRSLSALGDVMAALANKDARHVPFRNSKLTQLLQDSLCGQAKAMMFIHIAPEVRGLFQKDCHSSAEAESCGVGILDGPPGGKPYMGCGETGSCESARNEHGVFGRRIDWGSMCNARKSLDGSYSQSG